MKRSDSRLKIVLRVLRDAAELTQTQLGGQIHVDRNVIGRIENGAEIHPDVLSDWVRACGGNNRIDWLIGHLQIIKEYVESINRNYRAYA